MLERTYPRGPARGRGLGLQKQVFPDQTLGYQRSRKPYTPPKAHPTAWLPWGRETPPHHRQSPRSRALPWLCRRGCTTRAGALPMEETLRPPPPLQQLKRQHRRLGQHAAAAAGPSLSRRSARRLGCMTGPAAVGMRGEGCTRLPAPLSSVAHLHEADEAVRQPICVGAPTARSRLRARQQSPRLAKGAQGRHHCRLP